MKAFGEKNLQPDIFCVCDDPRDAMLWVQEGLATAVFPRSMEDLCTDLPIRIIEEEKLKTRILLAWKKDRRPSAVMQDLSISVRNMQETLQSDHGPGKGMYPEISF